MQAMLPRSYPYLRRGRPDWESAIQIVRRAIPERRKKTASRRKPIRYGPPSSAFPLCDGECFPRLARKEQGGWRCGKTNSCRESTIYDLRFTSQNNAARETGSTGFLADRYGSGWELMPIQVCRRLLRFRKNFL